MEAQQAVHGGGGSGRSREGHDARSGRDGQGDDDVRETSHMVSPHLDALLRANQTLLSTPLSGYAMRLSMRTTHRDEK
ncbi:hypothetical protein GCM10010468_46600 [Actinocorallia longicatena]|uniref:Uncharacterized protein n=1 Tax=Actinocorallia longicatena TaxID=111803 RepID=A0ABP6QE92_9ACTN